MQMHDVLLIMYFVGLLFAGKKSGKILNQCYRCWGMALFRSVASQNDATKRDKKISLVSLLAFRAA